MTQERREQSHPPQTGNDKRLQVLRQLQRRLYPFGEGVESEGTRAHELHNLYLQMADPSLDYLESIVVSLTSMPYENLEQLKLATYEAGDSPKRFLTKHGIVVNDSERLLAGIGNSEELIGHLSGEYNYTTHKFNLNGKELNPKTSAEYMYERIQIRNGERQMGKMIERVKNESDLRRRYRMGLNLKKRVLGYIDKFSFTFHSGRDGEELMEPTWKNLTRHYGWYTEIKTRDGSRIAGNFGIQDAVRIAQAAITRHGLEKRLDKLPSRDLKRFEQLRFQYGAKAANLIILSELANDINKVRKGDLLNLVVPDFKALPVDLYRAWKEGKLSDVDLKSYFEWVNGLREKEAWGQEEHNADYIVRSSAVFSEDGANITGAGIYDSVKVHGGATFQDFKDAVIKVYESTNSPRAQSYRTQHRIDREEMGLVMQKYVTPDYTYLKQSQEGYVNSKLAGVPQLMEIVTRTSRNFIRRKELDFFLGLSADGNKEAFREVHHFPPEISKIMPRLIFGVAQLTSAIERIWGKDIQVEFVADVSAINFVQVRELPATTFSQMPEVKFPDEPSIHSGASIGTGDMKLPVLDSYDNNSEKTGIVIISTNDMFSMRNDSCLPKKGVVIISNYGGRNGHIQTLCTERDLICLFPDVTEEDKPVLTHHELSRLKRVRIVSNGIEGRIYEIPEEEASEIHG